MSDQDELLSTEIAQDIVREQMLCIEKVVGGYAGALGLQKGDILAGVNGVPFYGTKSEFNALFDFDDENEDDLRSKATVLTIDRSGMFFNVVAHMRVLCSFKQVDAPFEEFPEKFQEMLLHAENTELTEYLVYYDNRKNCELLLRTRSLMAMVVPPFWLLNQRMPEAATAVILAIGLTFAVNFILGVIFYCILCLYVGREQQNLAMSFMSYKRMIFMQQIAAVSELEAQKTAIGIDPELYFIHPVEGLVQEKRKRLKAKTKPKNSETAQDEVIV